MKQTAFFPKFSLPDKQSPNHTMVRERRLKSNFFLKACSLHFPILTVIMHGSHCLSAIAKICFLVLSFFSSFLSSSAQELSASTNLFRDGDALIKQELDFKSPGRKGEKVVWDFSQLSFKDKEYRCEYTANGDSLFEMLTPSATYIYKLEQDTLLKTGYEMPNLSMKYVVPQRILKFPFCYSDSMSSCFVALGTYSHLLRMHVYGHSTVAADATGILLLPDGTGYGNAIRIHDHTVYGERMYSLSDGIMEMMTAGDVMKRLDSDSVKWIVDTYQWYARGYRYPVFETIETRICNKGDSLQHFRNAYYIARDVQEDLYTDEVNERLREMSLENYAAQDVGQNVSSESLSQNSDFHSFHYNCFLTDGNQNLKIEFYREKPSPIEITLSNIHGIVYHHAHSEAGTGIETVDFNVSNLPAAVYILSVSVDGERFSEKIDIDRKQ